MKEKKFTLSTREGCLRLLALFLCIILAASLCARIVSTDFGKLKIEKLTLDVRGGALAAEMYYPAGTNADDSLPAVVVMHGGGVNNGVMRPLAAEIARRGFVVMNVSFYGSGLSEWVDIDDGGQTPETFTEAGTPGGLLDVVKYLQNVEFVDSTRIGIAGHSAGGVRANAALLKGGSIFTYNDLLINVLYDTFGQTFTEEEIYQDASELAKARLNDDQLAYFEKLAADVKADYDNRVKTIVCLGAIQINAPQTVTVGGIEVSRTASTNFFSATGTYQKNSINNMSGEALMGSLYSSEPIERNCYYALDDQTGTSTKLGGLADRSSELVAAADARRLRGVGFNTETHSENFFSFGTNANVINMMELTLNHDSGMATSDQIWLIRVIFNAIAMFAMLAMMFPFFGLLLKTKFFAPCAAEGVKSKVKFNKKLFWITAVITVAGCAFAMYKANTAGPFEKYFDNLYHFFVGPNQTRWYLGLAAVVAIIVLAINVVAGKKACGETGLTVFGNGIGVKAALKNLLMALLFTCFAYISLLCIEYMFNEDYRLWMTAFGEVKMENWFEMLPYIICVFPCYVVISAAINYTVRDDIPAWKDTLIVVAVNSLGALIVWAINAIHNGFFFVGTEWSSFTCSYNMLLMIPLTVYIMRKTYKMTNNVWLGAGMNTMIVVWTIACSGHNPMVYMPQNWLANLLGL